jgi:hypothetical protein
MNTTDAKNSMARAMGGVFILVGSLIAIAGAIWLGRTTLFAMNSVKAPGIVLEMDRGSSNDGGSVYYPIYQFTDSSGVTHTQKTPTGSSSYSFEPGEKVTILYDPKSPKISNIDSFGEIWLTPILITGFGLIFGGFAYFWLFLANRAIQIEKNKDIVEQTGPIRDNQLPTHTTTGD